MAPSLLVHIVFHPESDDGLKLARRIHSSLNTDPVVPGLRVATAFCPNTDGRPPDHIDLDQAERSFVVLLADLVMYVDETGWCPFAGDVWEQCHDSPHRFLPVQLDEDTYQLDDRLGGTNFVRAVGLAADARDDFVVRRLVIELCRFLHGDAIGEDDHAEAPTKVFLSHTKIDIDAEPRAAQSLREAFGADQPIKAWYDSGDIGAGSEFATCIAEGIEDSSLLCVLTDNYANREWCRREVLLAKREKRPIVVIDALTSQEVRSFPYLGNLPVLRWSGDPTIAIDLVLKETLRDLHTRATLRQCRREGDVVFTRPPELLTIGHEPPGTTILYPDPPLGLEETETLERTGLHVVTPLQRLSEQRDLPGVRIALSMSESADIAEHGFDGVHLTSTMLEISRQLLISGVTLVYGGHLGDDGYTTQLTELVRAHNALPGVEPVDRLENYVGWPLPLDTKTKAKYKQVAKLVRTPRPDDIDDDLDPELVAEPATYLPASRSPRHRFAWARGMTTMREIETDSVSARIVLGGTIGPTVKRLPDGRQEESWYSGRIPGVLEEVLLSAKDHQPVFLLGAFGGVPAFVMDVLEGRERTDMTWEFHANAPGAREIRDLYEERGVEWWDYPAIAEFLRDRGLRGLNPLLTEDEHRTMFRARHPEAILEILMEGLGRLTEQMSS